MTKTKWVDNKCLHGPDKLNAGIAKEYEFGNSPSTKGEGTLSRRGGERPHAIVKVPPPPPQE